jgi:hypothetical protein
MTFIDLNQLPSLIWGSGSNGAEMPFQKLRSSRVAKPDLHIKWLAGWRRGYQ